MRKFWTILVLCCLLFLTSGHYFLYRFRLAEVKSAMKKELVQTRHKDLLRLSFSAEEASALQWEEANEFRYRGKMYDVVATEQKGGEKVYWCLPDKKETALIDYFLKQNDKSRDSSPSTSLFKLLQTPFLPANDNGLQTHLLKNQMPPFSYLRFLPSTDERVQTPPPKTC